MRALDRADKTLDSRLKVCAGVVSTGGIWLEKEARTMSDIELATRLLHVLRAYYWLGEPHPAKLDSLYPLTAGKAAAWRAVEELLKRYPYQPDTSSGES